MQLIIIFLLIVIMGFLITITWWIIYLSEQISASNHNLIGLHSELSKIYKLGAAYVCHEVVK